MKADLPELTPEDHGRALYFTDRGLYFGFLALGAAACAIGCWTSSLVPGFAAGWFFRSAFSMRRASEYPMSREMKALVEHLNEQR